MERYDIINLIVEKKGIRNYLEIGVRNPWECFDRIQCQNKMSVDPGIESEVNYATYKFTSDDFFKKLEKSELDIQSDYKWDLIFIDGLHLAEQCYRDFINSLKHLEEGGYIVFHDTCPPSWGYAREDYLDHSTPAGGWWNGTVWKAVQYIHQNHNLDLATVNSDWGVSVFKNSLPIKNLSKNLNLFFEFNEFDKYREEILNIKEISDFKEWI